MEGPIEFDVLGSVDPEQRDNARLWLIDALKISDREARKRVMNSVVYGEDIRLGDSLGWNEVQLLLRSKPNGFKSISTVEYTYSVNERMNYCKKHDLYFATTDICPVCSGWYLNTDKHGNKVKA